MTKHTNHQNGLPDSAEWAEFRRDMPHLRREIERALRRQLLHDPRAATARIQNLSPSDLADEALAWALSEWRSKPAGTLPALWVRKHALQLLDESLDAEALAAESRAEERQAEGRLLQGELLADEDERARWLEMVDGAGDPPVPFDGLVADDAVSRVESRLDETELLQQLDNALARLPELRRRVVVHSFIDELPTEDVAYLLDVTSTEVANELATAMKSLRLDLSPRG